MKIRDSWKRFTRERPIFHLGPIHVALSGIPAILFGGLLTIFLAILITQGGVDFGGKAGSALGLWNDTNKLLALAVLAGLLFVFHVKVRGKWGFWLSTAIYVGFPFALYYIIEFINGMDAYGRGPELVFMNVVFIAVVFLLCLAIFGSYRWSTFVATLLLYIFGVACYFVLLFRGTPFVPLDIFAAGTGMNVASNYTFALNARLIGATVCTALLLGIGYQLGYANLVRVRWKVTMRVLAVVAVMSLGMSFFSQSFLQEKQYVISYWDQESSYEDYGNWMAFCINLRNVFPEKPDNYSAGAISDTVDDFLEENDVDPKGEGAYNMISGKNDYTPTDKKPNIIMIMNESFTDLPSMGDLQTNIEVLPFLNHLKENTIRGNLQASTHGGGTACTEYEALTGNAQRFLSPGSVAYSASMRESTPSMAWNLRELGYQTESFHPYYASGWSREKAYAYMGFESFTALEDLVPDDLIEMTAAERIAKIEKELDPNDGDVYNRDYMSDHYDYKLVEDMYEARDKSKPYFMFNVTIQNHGGYLDPCSNFKEEVQITNMEGNYPQANRFLSLMHASDKAFEELLTYFKERPDEPTIVVMFGDHWPTLEKGFYTELFGQSPDTFSLETTQKFYQTPFVIWANYDIPEKDMGTISVNYLSPLIMEAASLQMTDYERYLATQFQYLPVISNVGYVDGEGKVFAQIPEDNPALQSLLNDYQCVAYNNLLDPRHRDWSVFTHDGEKLPSVKAFSHK